MITLLISLAVLIGGYFVYGLIADRVFGTDPSRPTPAMTDADGVDFVPMPTWKVFLIQFLNIAGLGPIFGAIMGVMYGPAAFLWIVLGTIFGGAVHDFISGMMSLRSKGLSQPDLIGRELGAGARMFLRALSTVLLILVGAVFIASPAELLDKMTPEWGTATLFCVIIFAYYLLATLLPVDKLIGRFYPIFGCALLFMALGLLGAMIFGGLDVPEAFDGGLANRHSGAETHSIFPMLFVSIACGAVSGFHATQSPMMARCLKNERLARPVFYGAMVAEGIVALIWAAAAITFTGGYEGVNAYMADGGSPSTLVNDISVSWLGAVGGILAVLGVVAAPITTGDTALRSARLIVADIFKIDQKPIAKRLMITIPIFLCAFGLLLIDFNVLWRYFAWVNQTLAAFTLWGCAVYLSRHGRQYVICMIPAMFMTAVVVCYLFYAPRPEGFGLGIRTAGIAAAAATALCTALFARYLVRLRSSHIPDMAE
mgnify:CR=1 FL=1